MNEVEEKRKEELSALAYFLTKMCDSSEISVSKYYLARHNAYSTHL